MLLKTVNAILDVFQDGIVISDQQGIIRVSNTRYSDVSAIPSQSIIGQPVLDLVRQGLFDMVLNPEVVATKEPALRLQKLFNGKQLILHGYPVFGPTGHVDYVVTFIRDTAMLGDFQAQIQAQRAFLDMLEQPSGGKCLLPFELQSPAMRAIYGTASAVAGTDATVLLLGETGVGKDVLASRIHAASHWCQGPFIKVDCGSLPESLIEAELFGYAGGTFSGGNKGGKEGLFEAATGGTLFLDEVGELPYSMQTRLLRALQDREVRRVGETRSRPVNTRVIAATNKNLEREVEGGTFRRDLYYRLKVAVLDIPPLRSNVGDILPLARFFLHHYNVRYGRHVALGEDAGKVMQAYSWPGNIRELENCMHSLCVQCGSTTAHAEDLGLSEPTPSGIPLSEADTKGCPYKESMEKFESQLLVEAMRKHGSLARAAKHLKMDRTTLFRRLKLLKARGYPAWTDRTRHQ